MSKPYKRSEQLQADLSDPFVNYTRRAEDLRLWRGFLVIVTILVIVLTITYFAYRT